MRAAGLTLPAGRHLAHGRHHPLGETASPKRSRGEGKRCVLGATTAARRLPALGDPRQVVAPEEMENAPASLHSLDVKSRDMRGQKYVLQVAEDCTGCNLCASKCVRRRPPEPGIKAINMMYRLEHVEEEGQLQCFLSAAPEIDREKLERIDIRTSQLISPLFEYSSACSGCGRNAEYQTADPALRRPVLIANATGCSSIYGAAAHRHRHTTNANGRDPAWSQLAV